MWLLGGLTLDMDIDLGSAGWPARAPAHSSAAAPRSGTAGSAPSKAAIFLVAAQHQVGLTGAQNMLRLCRRVITPIAPVAIGASARMRAALVVW
jgi:hypothetical protein